MKSIFLCFFLIVFTQIFSQITHEVQPKETVYGIAKQYGVSQVDLIKANPSIQDGLQIGAILNIPGKEGEYVAGKSKVISEDKDFVYVEIAPKETLYSLSRRYNLSTDDLISANPQLSEGLKIGDTIRIPKTEEVISSVTVSEVTISPEKPRAHNFSGNYSEFFDHVITPSETILSLMLNYNISYQEILKHNPQLESKGLVVNEIVKIPMWYKPEAMAKYNDGEINLALLLPFYLGDDSKKGVQKVAVDFLTGANIALDSLSRTGKKINLQVVDTKNSKSEIRKFLEQKNTQQLDAIIGPFYESVFMDVAQQFQEDYMPIFSPTNNSKKLNSYKNVFISQPREESLADEIIIELLQRYNGEQIIILTDSKSADLAEYTKNKIEEQSDDAKVLITRSLDELVQPSETVSETLEDGTLFEQTYYTPIVAVLVSTDNNLGKNYVEKLKEMDPENLVAYGIKYVSSYDVTKKRNQPTIAALQNIGFAFSADRLANIFGKDEKVLIGKFKDLYCVSPNRYQQIGFDLMFDVVSRMDENGFLEDNTTEKQSGFSGNYQYQKVLDGEAKINRAVRVLRLFKKPTTEIVEEAQ